MNENIFESIKTMIAPEDDAFDPDIMFHINSALHVLGQLGAGNTTFSLTPETIGTAVWGDYVQKEELLNVIKDYVFVRVKLGFDPPATGYLVDVYKERQKEYENRILYELD